MHKTIIFGAHGKVGQKLVQLVAKAPQFQATAVVRNAQQAQKIAELGLGAVATVEASLSDMPVSALARVIAGHDSVVLTVGSGGKELLQVDLDGVVKAFEAADAAGTRRVVLVSALFAENREFAASTALRNYYIAKHYADRILEHEFGGRLEYTILKPTSLADGAGTGKLAFLQPGDGDFGSVDRADVAAAIVAVLTNAATFGRSYDFKSGDRSIGEPSTWE